MDTRVNGGPGGRALVLCHFPSTFQEILQTFDTQNIEYDIVETWQADTSPRREDESAGGANVQLTLCQALSGDNEEATDAPQRWRQTRFPWQQLFMIVTERHPLASYDQALEQFVRSLPNSVTLGYLLSLEDPLLRRVVSQESIQLLQQIGLEHNDLISSQMIHRYLNRFQKNLARQMMDEQMADSLEEWLEKNMGSIENGSPRKSSSQ